VLKIILLLFNHWFSALSLPLPSSNLKLSSLRNGDSSVNDNGTNQWCDWLIDWLNEEKWSCCTCGAPFGAILWRGLPNDEVKFSYLRFWRTLAEVDLSFSAFISVKQTKCTTGPTWNKRKTLNLTQSSVLMQRFRYICRRSFLNFRPFWDSDGNASPQQYIFHSHHLYENYSCQASELAVRLFHKTWPTWNCRRTLDQPQNFYFEVKFLLPQLS